MKNVARLNLFDGAEIRIDQCEDRVEFTVLTYLIRSKLIDANSNYAPAMAIAA